MNFSYRFGVSAFLAGALSLGCGSTDQGIDNGAGGSTGSGGSGGAGGAGAADAGDDAPSGTMDASSSDAPEDRGSPGTREGGSDGKDAPGLPPPPGDAPPDDLIREMLDRFQVAEIEAKTRELESKSLPDRFTKTPTYTAATEWIRDFMAVEAPNAAVRFDEWDGYRNIEFTIKGTDPAAGIWIVGGHLDSVRNTVAMDDDGSGALGVALIARALSFYRYKAEIRCVIFDAEEGGLIGSAHYAQALKASGCEANSCLKVYINLDEIAYDPNHRNSLRIWSDSQQMKDYSTQVNAIYGIGLTFTMGTGSCHRSDDCSFADQGYVTVYNFQTSQSPYYHMPGDTSDTLNFGYLTKNLKLTAGVLATGAVPVGRHP